MTLYTAQFPTLCDGLLRAVRDRHKAYAAAKDRRAHKTINNNNGRGLFSTPVEYPATQMVGVTAMALVENGEQRDGGRRSWLRTQREKQRE